MQKLRNKAFTLVETLIVLVIIGILGVVLCESYITVSKVALQVEQQKNISEESLTLTQIFQSIADESTINYSKYMQDGKSILATTSGYTDKLYLTGGDWAGTSIYSTGNCLTGNEDLSYQEDGESKNIQDYTGCKLVLEREGEGKTELLSNNIIESKAMFRIIPYQSDADYFNTENDNYIAINDVHKPAFWVFIHLYAPLYQPEGTNKIDQALQLFFNLNE